MTCICGRPASRSFFARDLTLKRSLGLHPVFEPIPPIAEAQFTYCIAGNRIDVSCTIRSLTGRLPSVFILSELAADSFTHAFSKGKAMKPPSGWARYEPGNDLYDPVHRLRFTLSPNLWGDLSHRRSGGVVSIRNTTGGRGIPQNFQSVPGDGAHLLFLCGLSQ